MTIFGNMCRNVVEIPIDLTVIEAGAKPEDIATITTFGGTTSLVGVRRHIFDAFDRGERVNIGYYGVVNGNGARGVRWYHNGNGNPANNQEKHSNSDWVYFQQGNDIAALKKDIENVKRLFLAKALRECSFCPCNIPRTTYVN